MLRLPTEDDIPQMLEIAQTFVDNGWLHPISEDYLRENLRLFFVRYRPAEDEILGFAALQDIEGEDFGIIKCVVVKESAWNQGIARQMVGALGYRARGYSIKTLYLITCLTKCFEKLNFKILDASEVPEEVPFYLGELHEADLIMSRDLI